MRFNTAKWGSIQVLLSKHSSVSDVPQYFMTCFHYGFDFSLLLHDIKILSIFLKKFLNLDVVTHTCNFKIWETEAGGLL